MAFFPGHSHGGCFACLFPLLSVSLLVVKLHVVLPCSAGITPYGVRGTIAYSKAAVSAASNVLVNPMQGAHFADEMRCQSLTWRLGTESVCTLIHVHAQDGATSSYM